MSIYLATTNPGKLKEIREMLQMPLNSVDIEIDEVQSMDLEYVSKRKAEEAFKKLKKPVIVDDVGVFVEAWNGFPGPFVKHLFSTYGYDGFLKLLEGESNRNAHVAAAVSYHDGKKVHTFLGEFDGQVAKEKRGENGWGFDPIIIPGGYSITLAEMEPSKKNEISHRGRAFRKLKEFLDSQKK